jgi:phage FluMu protein Com
MVDLLIIYVIITAIIFIAIFMLLPRYGPHTVSRLTCPKCKKKFNYHWVPGASFISLYRGNKRRLRCPYCHEVSTFDITSTKMTKEQVQLLKNKK